MLRPGGPIPCPRVTELLEGPYSPEQDDLAPSGVICHSPGLPPPEKWQGPGGSSSQRPRGERPRGRRREWQSPKEGQGQLRGRPFRVGLDWRIAPTYCPVRSRRESGHPAPTASSIGIG